MKLNKKHYLYLTGFFSGMSVTAIEISASRLLAPYFGTSVYVWTSVIGITLLALALGYYFGGRFIDRKPQVGVYFMVLLMAGIFGMLIPVLAKPISTFAIAVTSNIFNTSAVIILGSFLAMLILFALPLILLGMVSPSLIRLITKDKEESGRVAGSVFFITTLGSLVGTFLPALLFIPFLGTKKTIVIFSAVLIFFGLSFFSKWQRWSLVGILLLGLTGSMLSPSVVRADVLYETESAYQYISVLEAGGNRYLTFNDSSGYQSVYNANNLLIDNTYYNYYLTLPYLAQKNPGANLDVLIIGLAGGTISRQYHELLADEFNLHIDGVEIDKKVIDVGKEYFELDNPSLDIINEDGRMYLAQTDKKYDIIIIDAYSQQLYIPFHLSTKEFFTNVADHLQEGGLMAINVNAFSNKSRLLNSFYATIEAVFKNTNAYKATAYSNHIIIGSKDNYLYDDVSDPDNQQIKIYINDLYDQKVDMEPQTENIFTDDKAPIELLTDKEYFNYWLENRK
ncbi:MAG: fused MFS/spermidine synthase [bacterium]